MYCACSLVFPRGRRPGVVPKMYCVVFPRRSARSFQPEEVVEGVNIIIEMYNRSFDGRRKYLV
jgi:hypothetical protein